MFDVQAEAAGPWHRVRFLRASCMFCELGASGKRCRWEYLAAPVPSINTFWNGNGKESLWVCGAKGWRNMTRWKESLGGGRASQGQWSRLPWRWKRLARIQPIG